jgi:hypothetical protein
MSSTRKFWSVMDLPIHMRRIIRAEAQARHIPIREYITRLVELHEVTLSMHNEEVQEQLRILDMQEVREEWNSVTSRARRSTGES